MRIRGGLRRVTPPFLAPAVGRLPSCCCGWGGSHRVDDNKRNHRGRGVCSLVASSAWPLRVLLGASSRSAVAGYAGLRLPCRRRSPALLAALRAVAAAPLQPRLAAPARRQCRRAPVRWPFGVGRLGGCYASPHPPHPLPRGRPSSGTAAGDSRTFAAAVDAAMAGQRVAAPLIPAMSEDIARLGRRAPAVRGPEKNSPSRNSRGVRPRVAFGKPPAACIFACLWYLRPCGHRLSCPLPPCPLPLGGGAAAHLPRRRGRKASLVPPFVPCGWEPTPARPCIFACRGTLRLSPTVVLSAFRLTSRCRAEPLLGNGRVALRAPHPRPATDGRPSRHAHARCKSAGYCGLPRP